MSSGNPESWGTKGKAIGIVLVTMFLFFFLLIWVYKKNQHGLN